MYSTVRFLKLQAIDCFALYSASYIFIPKIDNLFGIKQNCINQPLYLTALKLISRPLTEWVSAPTEMKSTPQRA